MTPNQKKVLPLAGSTGERNKEPSMEAAWKKKGNSTTVLLNGILEEK